MKLTQEKIEAALASKNDRFAAVETEHGRDARDFVEHVSCMLAHGRAMMSFTDGMSARRVMAFIDLLAAGNSDQTEVAAKLWLKERWNDDEYVTTFLNLAASIVSESQELLRGEAPAEAA